MKKYTLVLASRVDKQILRHFEFLLRVSYPAAKQFRDSLGGTLTYAIVCTSCAA